MKYKVQVILDQLEASYKKIRIFHNLKRRKITSSSLDQQPLIFAELYNQVKCVCYH